MEKARYKLEKIGGVTMEYLKIRKGDDFVSDYHRAKVLEVYRNFVLGKVYDPTTGFMFYDILTAKSYPNEGIKLHQSPGMVGLRILMPGSAGTPIPEAEMRQKWQDFIDSIERTERSHAETEAGNRKREEKYIAKKRKMSQAQEHRKALEIQIRELVAESETASDFIKSKKAQKLASEMQMTNIFTTNI